MSIDPHTALALLREEAEAMHAQLQGLDSQAAGLLAAAEGRPARSPAADLDPRAITISRAEMALLHRALRAVLALLPTP